MYHISVERAQIHMMGDSVNHKFGLCLLIALRSIVFLMTSLLLFVALNIPFDNLSKWRTLLVLFCNIVTILVLLFICRAKETTYWNFINFEKGKTKRKTIVIVMFVMLVVGMCGMQLAGLISYGEIPHFPIMMIQPIPLWIAIINIFLLPLTTTVAEDGIYLGAINQNDSKSIVIGSAFFYALQHSFIPFLPDARFILYRFLSFLPIAIIMCFWYRKNKNPLPFMVGHFVLNLATVVQIVIISASPGMLEQMLS